MHFHDRFDSTGTPIPRFRLRRRARLQRAARQAHWLLVCRTKCNVRGRRNKPRTPYAAARERRWEEERAVTREAMTKMHEDYLRTRGHRAP